MTKVNKVLFINSVNYGSTGTIMLQIAHTASDNGYEAFISYPPSRSNYNKKISNNILIGNRIERNIHLKLGYLTGMHGDYSTIGTKKLLKRISKINPDIIHLHNLHNCFINLELLFDYIKNQKISVVWTLHDCWAFTGQCPHYTMAKCEKWKTECNNCPLYRQYPAARIDKTKEKFYLKKKWFTGVDNLTLVTPSVWLKKQVELSFLSEYPVVVINNGIDLSIFKHTASDFREKYDLKDKIILLGVANPWSAKKGLNVFVELSKLIDEKYKIVLVGLSEKQIEDLPENILGLPKTNNQTELAKIYSAADYFINPSVEETMGLVTVEALACGTPVIVSNSTAVPEVVTEDCGVILNENQIDEYISAITNTDKDFSSSDCVKQAKKYDKKIKYEEYMTLYKRVISRQGGSEK